MSRIIQDRYEAVGQKVYVYLNSPKRCWSVRDTKTGRVVAHCRRIALDNVQFKVSAKRRDRVRREGRKNLHAGAQGIVAKWQLIEGPTVTYNPKKYDGFVTMPSKTAIAQVSYLVMDSVLENGMVCCTMNIPQESK